MASKLSTELRARVDTDSSTSSDESDIDIPEVDVNVRHFSLESDHVALEADTETPKKWKCDPSSSQKHRRIWIET